MRRFFARLANLFRTRRAEHEMSREIEAHLVLLQDEFESQGMSPEDARRAAKRAYGGVEQSKELHRETRSFLWIEQFAKDALYGFRQLRRSPGFTLTAIGALALGIGANTAIFSAVNVLLLKPLPVPDPDRFVVLMNTSMTRNGESDDNPFASPARFIHWRNQTNVLQDVTAVRATAMNYTGGEVIEQWPAVQITADGFRTLGLPLLYGRGFTQEEDLPSGPHVAVLGAALWKRRFADDPRVIGTKNMLNGEPYTIVGVVDDTRSLLGEFLSDVRSGVYVPFQIDPNTRDQGQSAIFAFGRLKPGVTLAQAKERIRASANEFRIAFPKALGPKDGFTVKPVREAVVENLRVLLLVVSGAVCLVLLIACANVANVLLARTTGRGREIGIRLAIGAGRGRVVRQLLTESVLLSIAGGAAGLLVGFSGLRALVASALVASGGADDLPGARDIGIDWRVMVFTLALSLLTALIFGLLPALRTSRVDLNAVLKDSGGQWGTGLRQNKLRGALVICEVSLAVVLLVGSALLIRTFAVLYTQNRGYESKNVLTMQTSFSEPKYMKTASVAATVSDALERVRSLPGVVAASSTACCVPMQGDMDQRFDIVGRPSGGSPNTGGAGWTIVSPGYFEAFQIPVKRGRVFDERDGAASPPVAVINERMAREFWKNGDPLNDRIVIGKGGDKDWEDAQPRQIIGIVGDVRQGGLETAPRPRMYVPQAQLPDTLQAQLVHLAPSEWIVRMHANNDALTKSIQEQVRQATGLPVFEVHSMDEVIRISMGEQRLNMQVMSIFGGAALLLAAIGIYGLMAYTVAQRTQEMGIRLALGAQAAQLRNMILRQGMSMATAGVVIGLAAAWGVSRLMESLLFGVKPRDPVVFTAVPVALLAVALLSVWIPARWALRVDPAVSLRHE